MNSSAQGILKAFSDTKRLASVAICFHNSKLLLGLASADDDRDGKWCFPGGGIEDGESGIEAASRGLYEEAGVIGKPLNMLCVSHPNKPGVYFHVFTTDSEDLTPNKEFSDMKWFSVNELPNNLYPLNKTILEILKVDRPKN